jgi:hypothetical protein
VWLARAWLAEDAQRALVFARAAQPAMAGSDDNAARRWQLAQSLGEEAAALAALGRREEASAAAARATQVWREASPAGQVPAQFAALAARDSAAAR